MTPNTNDRYRAALALDGIIEERAFALLNELDALISELDRALADAAAARIVIADTETEMAAVEASITLGTSGPNGTARKAAATLAIREDAGDPSFAAAMREARASLYSAERRQTVSKQRIYLLRAALALLDVPTAERQRTIAAIRSQHRFSQRHDEHAARAWRCERA